MVKGYLILWIYPLSDENPQMDEKTFSRLNLMFICIDLLVLDG